MIGDKMAKKTHEEFIKELQNINPNISILGRYINSKTKIKCICKIDDYTWYGRPDQLLQNHGCPLCSGKIKKTNEQFVEEMKNINPNIDILGSYINSRTKLLCKCKIDGHEWMAKPNGLLNGTGCAVCAGNKKKTHDEFIKEMSAINPNITILSKYINSETPVLCRCNIDEYEWTTSPSSLLQGKGCKKCAGTKTITNNEFTQFMLEYHPNIDFHGKYYNGKTKIKCKCKIDGYEWVSEARSLLRKHGCRKCAGTLPKTHEEFIQEARIKNSKVTVVGIYSGTKNKILCRCNKCLHEWYTFPSLVLYNHGCPVCSNSKGEEKILSLLNKYNINSVCQKTFDNCVSKYKLRFDFYIPSNNICIEYQGIQHYEPVDFANKGNEWANKLFETNQKKDNIKRKFCKNNNIRLLEIPYWDFDNIEEILSRELGIAA